MVREKVEELFLLRDIQKKKQRFVIRDPESFNSTPEFICGFTAKIFYQERYLQSQFWFRYERSTVRSS